MSSTPLLYVCLLTLIGLLPGCSRTQDIVGTWQWADAQSFFQFQADGTFRSLGEDASKVSGRYSLSGSSELRIDIAGSPAPKIMKVDFKSGEMTLTEGGLALKLHKVDPSKIRPAISLENEASRHINSWLAPATNQPKQKP